MLLLFNRLRAGRQRARDDPVPRTAPNAGVLQVDDNTRGVINSSTTEDIANNGARRRGILHNRVNLSMPKWRRRRNGANRRQNSSSNCNTSAIRDGGPISSPPSHLNSRTQHRTTGSGIMEPFSPLNGRDLEEAKIDNTVPAVIADKIQSHHELWYRLAYGRTRDRRVSGGYGMAPARLAGKPVPRAQAQDGTHLPHITSWRSRPQQLKPWAGETPSSFQSATSAVSGGGGQPKGHFSRGVMSIDYTNAHEVVLSNTRDAEGAVLGGDDVLPPEAPKFLIHPYDKRKVIMHYNGLGTWG